MRIFLKFELSISFSSSNNYMASDTTSSWRGEIREGQISLAGQCRTQATCDLYVYNKSWILPSVPN
jgi:hypothetical protein